MTDTANFRYRRDPSGAAIIEIPKVWADRIEAESAAHYAAITPAEFVQWALEWLSESYTGLDEADEAHAAKETAP